MAVLHQDERTILSWTLGKFFLLYDQHMEWKGLKKEEMSIDDLI